MTRYPHDDRTTPVLDGEVWKSHPTKAFDLSDYGRVRSQKTGRFVGWLSAGKGARAATAAPYLPYMRVGNTSQGRHRVHILVLETFVGPRPDGNDGDHVDHDRLNNRLTNLRWRPTAENRADTIREATR